MKSFLGFGRSKQKAKTTVEDVTETSSAGATTTTTTTTSATTTATPSSRSSCSSSRSSSREYEVFLNFRGPDSRYTVANVIYDALVRAGVRVFYDDESIRPGEVIEGELEEAIIKSKIYIPIFSKDYASSKWCLRELELMLLCWSCEGMHGNKWILPIFYDVDVSTDLKLKSELYTTALRKHKAKLGALMVQPWEVALRMVARIKGWDIRNHGLTELSKLIVEEVCCKLWTTSESWKVSNNYVGIDNPMEDIMKLLDLDAYDVRFVTIHGIGGMGKTTLATQVFTKISSHFKGSGRGAASLSDIREKSLKNDGMVNLQEDLIRKLLDVKSLPFLRDANDGVNLIKDKLQHMKVLIVLDDLDKSDKLMKLAGEPSWFGMGSRIIITTRDVGIIPKHEGFYRYKMQEMKYDDALKLFSNLVFKSNLPPEGYNEISREVVDTTGRLPLAINVIAPLFRCNGKDAWKGILEKLKNVVYKDVRAKLMISYEQLDNQEREIFLDIACLFINEEIEDVTYYWEARQLYSKSGIMVLRNMSLIEIVDGNRLQMHDLLRDLGRNLVDEKTDIHGERSKIWSPEVALNVVHRKKGTKEVVAIRLGKLDMDCKFNYEQFAQLTNLKFLELNGGNFANEDFKEVFSELIWLAWDDCPPDFQATNFCFENLVVLMLSENLISDDWSGWGEIKVANNLKVLKCTYCRFLTKSPDFFAFPKLERLIFRNCAMLREIDPSIVELKHLTYLEITNPLIYMERLPDEYISYQLDEGESQVLPDSIGNLRSLSVLKLKFVNLSKLPHSIGELVNLKYMCVWCPKLKWLPESAGRLPSLIELDISFTAITQLPRSLSFRSTLRVLKCENCPLGKEEIKILMNNTGREKQLSIFNPIGTERIESLKNK